MFVRELVAVYRLREGWVTRHVPSSPQKAAALFFQLLGEEPVEVFGMLCLSARHRVIAYHEVSRGGVSTTLVSPRDVFKAALLANAAGVLVGHNHPSGDPSPSADDRALTDRLSEAGEVLNLPVVDHVIVGNGGRYFSFREAGRLPKGITPPCT